MVRSQFRRAEQLSSLNEDLVKAGKVPGTMLIHYAVGPLDDEIADVVDADDVRESDFIQIRRLRLADDVPLAILTNYLPARFEITGRLRERGLYACLNALGVHLKIAHQQISARLMTDEEAGLLTRGRPPPA